LVATTGLLEMRTPDVLFPNILPRVVGLLGIGLHALRCIQGDTRPRDAPAGKADAHGPDD
ncbi:hypothetical protein, partial [Azospirillum brasilense]|uniref:hypothetical protein n=1 Tax=Azospirillum brasilense TaxID=192 RepID=UPI00157A4BD7